jgi:hypothetical protein
MSGVSGIFRVGIFLAFVLIAFTSNENKRAVPENRHEPDEGHFFSPSVSESETYRRKLAQNFFS